MTDDPPKVNEAYLQMKLFLEQAKEESDLKTKFLLMEKDLENYVKKDKIYHMIKIAIEEHDKNIEKANKNKIQWQTILERVLTWAIIAIITAFLIKGWKL